MFSVQFLETQHATRARARPTFQHTPSRSLCGFVEIRAQTAASHHTMPTGACESAPDVRPGALGGRRAGFDVATLFCCRTGHFDECCKFSEPKLPRRRSSRVLMFGVLEHPAGYTHVEPRQYTLSLDLSFPNLDSSFLVRSGQVRFITRPKSRTMRAKRKKRSRANRTNVPK